MTDFCQSTSYKNYKHEEIQRIRDVCQKGKMNTLQTVKVDLFLENQVGSLFLFDLKTAKPNISNFKDFKKTKTLNKVLPLTYYRFARSEQIRKE